MNGDGKVVFKTAGYQSPEGFSAMMSRVLDFNHMDDWERDLKSKPNDITLLSKLGVLSAMKEDEKSATMYADRAKAAIKGSTDKAQINDYADLMNAVGDMYQNGNKPDPAIGYFEAAANSGADVGKVAYGLFSEGYCYLMLNKPQLALDIANKAAALPGLSKADADTVASLKKSATLMLNSKGK